MSTASAHLAVAGIGIDIVYEDAPEGPSVEQRRRLLDRWYRQRLHEAIAGTITRWEAKMGVRVSRWTVRWMKTKWGSCDRERGHGRRFTELLDGFMPDWRARRDRRNGSPLSHEEWTG